MKRIFTLISLMFAFTAYSQQYNNEWIDYSKVYYKFKVGQTGLYRIPQTVLNSSGLGATPAEQFKLFRNGVQVPIYTTSATGVLASDGYIEFWGEMNDGKADKVLYRDPKFQHSDKYSLQTDTAMYFLTTGTGSNLRLVERPNNVSSSSLPVEPYFMYTVGNHFRQQLNPGFARNAGEYIYSSSYDQGEYWSSAEISPGGPLVDNLSNLFVYPGGPQGYVRFGASGNAQNRRKINVKLNNTQVFDAEVSIFEDTNSAPLGFPSSLISGGAATMTFSNMGPDPQTPAIVNDRMVISYYDITYPRKFDFGGAKNFPFVLPAKSDGYLLSITNFNKGAVRPVLYDLTSGSRYTAEYSAMGDSVKFALPGAGVDRQFVLVNEEVSNVMLVSGLSSKTFINYSDASKEGNYLIISNPLLYTDVDGSNPVINYRDYRRSADGGGYSAVIYDIDELVDQFAFGIKKHPLSVKNFMRFARNKFSISPRYVFMIGRGADYVAYATNQTSPIIEQLNLVPTFGSPGSDNFLSSDNSSSAIPITPIGRLSAVHPYEVANYLEKIKEYEHTQEFAPNTLKDRLWMKNVMHVTGASQSELGILLCGFMEGYKSVFEDTLTGADVHTFCKSSANPVEQLSDKNVSDLFEQGLSMVTYFGHSSSTTLEFNINDPESYNSQGKYPVFSVNGCNAGNFFTFYPQRLEVNETLSEKFVLAKQKGAIAFMASTHFGIVNYLNIYLDYFYKDISENKYGQSLGIMFESSLSKMLNAVAPGDFFARCHSEEITLHGDPAIKMNFQAKPDYVIEEPQVKVFPAFLSVADKDYTVDVKMFNLGKAVNDSIMVEIKHQFPDGSIESLYRQRIKGIRYSDSIHLKIPVIGVRDKGLNKIIIALDADNNVDEMDENNNTITKEVFIYEEDAKPVSPYNYSIVSDLSQKLYASTANPFGVVKEYTVQIDTTELFNSSLMESKKFNLSGGVIEFDPNLIYKDSTVYYWRVGVPMEGGTIQWNKSSFVYLKNSSTGFNQSHYYQFAKNDFSALKIDEASRQLVYGTKTNGFSIHTGIYPYAKQTDNFSLDYGTGVQAGLYAPYTVNVNCLRFYIINGKTLLPWTNVGNGSTGQYGSYAPDPINGTVKPGFFQFNIADTGSRRNVMNFLDIIPKDDYVVMTNSPGDATILPSVWQDDTLYFGKNVSLYHKLVNKGFTSLSQINSHVPFVFIYREGQPIAISQTIAPSNAQVLNVIFTGYGLNNLGSMTSELFGPAKKWQSLHIEGHSSEQISSDSVSVEIIGVRSDDSETVLFAVKPPFDDNISLESVNQSEFPYLKLKLSASDKLNYTPYQLKSWKISAEFVPEGALAPNLFVATKDTLDIGEILNFGVAFKNISQTAFDSIKTNITIIDKDNVSHKMILPAKSKPLLVNDTIAFRYSIDTRQYPGANILSVDFNPDNDQPEQYHYNNFLYRNFYVRPDVTNPLMDVTFDGVHILNRDIVSSKPHIQIKIKDEAKFLLLSDTSIIKTLTVRYPDMNSTVKTYRFDNDTLKFIPADKNSGNTAVIDFSPYFPTILDDNGEPLNPDGDDYELTVSAKDQSGNNAGAKDFKVSFKTIDKPMISNLLNYPNPFTTSTAFVFTLTGSEVPQNFKIQILTVTGKIVREITREELGSLHIGRNITEFKWNGTDQYGQRLANGVYLYRVITALNGKRMEKYKSSADNTDAYFNKGYGKMYLMR